MPNFQISLIKNDPALHGVSLCFEGEQKEKLIIKNIRFCPYNHPKEIAEIHPVYLGDKPDEVFLTLPESSTDYEYVRFQIKQENSIGWDVDINLQNHKLTIAQAKYQVL